MAWSISGTYFETCSCDAVCPCTVSFDFGATHDYCRATLVFNVAEGEVDGVDVSGVSVVTVIDTPKVMTEGNWKLGLVIDERASDEQAEKLGAVFGGQVGGPMGGVAPLVGEVAGVERLRVDVTEDGLTHSVKIGDAVDFEVRDVVPFGSEDGVPARLTGILHPAGTELTIAQATRSSINIFGIAYDGDSAFSSANFAWAG